MKKLLALALLLGCGAVQAAPVTWTINNAMLISEATGEAGMLTGTFDYDSDTEVMSNIAIFSNDWIHEADKRVFDTHFAGIPNTPGTDFFGIGYAWPSAGQSYLHFYFDTALTNEGGTVAFSTQTFQKTFEHIYDEDGYAYTTEWNANLQTGATVSAVPIPAAAYLFASGLGLLGWMRRK